MIYLIFDGMCKDCTEADIGLVEYFADGKKFRRVSCSHYNACLRMKQKEDDNEEARYGEKETL